ncbi:MAG TPA: sensor histidine kinase [Rhodocyclaceae bacterium]
MTIRRLDVLLSRPRGSLWGRLMLFLLAPLLVLSALSIVSDYRSNLAQSNEAYDHALTSSAVALAALIGVHHGELRVDLPPSAEAMLRIDPVDKVFFAVFDSGNRRIAGDVELENKASVDEGLNPDFHDDVIKGQNVRVVTYRARGSGGEAVIVVAETVHKREKAATQAATKTATADFLLVMATLLTVFFGVRLALAPLTGLSTSIAQRTTSDLRPLPDSGVPSEVRPLVWAINQLMGNLRSAHEAQQAFLTNAAHQLRTPIAGLQTQLELAAENLPAEARPRMERLRDAFRRLSHLTHQMLALARSSAEADLAHEFQRTDLQTLCEEAASEFLDAALAKNIDLGFETEKTEVQGSRWLLRELLANLIDNAIRYTQEGGHVTVRCGHKGAGIGYLEVEDNGAGIPAEKQAHIFDRFYRADSQQPGTGLGLSIVQEVTQRHGATISLDCPASGQGSRFCITFPKDPIAG